MVATIRERHLLRELQLHVETETDEARERFPVPLELDTRAQQMASLMVQVGKMAEAGGKIELSADDQTADRWRREFVHRAIASISIIQRSVLSLHDWPALAAELHWATEESRDDGT